MAIRYAGRYHRSPYQQATRIPVKNILLFAILIIGGGGGGRFGISFRTNFFAGGETCRLHPPYFARWSKLRVGYSLSRLTISDQFSISIDKFISSKKSASL